MRSRNDMVTAFWLAVAAHALMFFFADGLLAMKSTSMVPIFKTGESSVLLTLMPAREDESEKMEPQEPDPEDLLLIEKPEEEIIEDVLEDNDADLLEKGVESVYEGNVDVRPRYPLGARLRGEEGVVRIGAYINALGRAEDVKVLKSSGYRALDRATVEAISRAKFVPSSPELTGGRRFIQDFRFELVEH